MPTTSIFMDVHSVEKYGNIYENIYISYSRTTSNMDENTNSIVRNKILSESRDKKLDNFLND